MGLSDLFIDPKSLPDDGYGFVQLLTLTTGYALVLYYASNMISDGSELLLLIPSMAGIVGSCVLPILGAVPDGMIVLFSGMGPDAQEQLDVGVGALAGSTIMLLTLPWALSIYAGRVNIIDGKAMYNAKGRKCDAAVTGVPNSEGVKHGGIIMLITSVSYIILQGPAFYYTSQGYTQAQVAAGEASFARVGLVVCVVLFVGYIWYQYQLSLSEDKGDVADARQVQTAIKQIESGAMTLRGCLQHELTQAGASPGDYQAVELGNPSDRQRARIRGILRFYYKKFDADNSGVLDVVELSKIFVSMGENVAQAKLDELFTQFDLDGDGSISIEEFELGVIQYLRNTVTSESELAEAARLSEVAMSVEQDQEDEEDDDGNEMPEDIAELPVEQQQAMVMNRSFTILGVGTLLVVLFSDPMTDVLGEIGARTGIPAFYISFVLAPMASNASELLASYAYAAKKSSKSISISLQALQGAACMNNTFCLAIFMALILFQSLAWAYSAETLSILFGQVCIAFISRKDLQTNKDVYLVLALYPFCLIMVAFLEAIGWD